MQRRVHIRTSCDSAVFEMRIPSSLLPEMPILNLQGALVDTARRVELDRTAWLSVVPD